LGREGEGFEPLIRRRNQVRTLSIDVCRPFRTPKSRKEPTDAVIASVDIFPTLCELTALPAPDFVQGRSLVPILNDPAAKGWGAYAYSYGKKTFRNERWRLIQHKSGPIELYDHASAVKETRNVADRYPEVVKRLSAENVLHLNH
jgi:iduronate 2-sulfatase